MIFNNEVTYFKVGNFLHQNSINGIVPTTKDVAVKVIITLKVDIYFIVEIEKNRVGIIKNLREVLEEI